MLYELNIAKQYTRFPGPRLRKTGEYSGEDFLDTCLLEFMQQVTADDQVRIVLDGTKGYGSSFLDESFAGLIREGIDPEIVKAIDFVSEEDPSIIDEIRGYVQDELNARASAR